MIGLQKFFVSDPITSYLKAWRNILLPGVLYGLEVMPWSSEQMDELDIGQNKMGKILLGLPPSTANVTIQALLGLKPIKQLILKGRVKLFQKAKTF